MAASIKYCIHVFSDENGPILPISEKIRWCGEGSWSKSPVIRCPTWTFVYCWISHVVCYRRFTYKTKIARSVKRCATVGLPSHDSFIDVHTSRKSVCHVECSSSRKTSDQLMRRNIICKGENILRIHIPRRDSGKSSQFANTHQVSWK